MRSLKTIFLIALIFLVMSPTLAQPDIAPTTTTPIKHVIIVIAENRSFDHVFATYKPPQGETVFNLLSEGIVNEDGSPGPNFVKAAQYRAQVNDAYSPAPANKMIYQTLPPLMTGNAPENLSDSKGPPFVSASAAAEDHGLLPADQSLLLTGATKVGKHEIDERRPNASHLPNGPFQITPGIPYNAYAASPVHRFFQMWQQIDCSATHATPQNPSGCLSDLFPWIEVSVGAGSNGKSQSERFNVLSTGEGSTAMGFYNMAEGDAPYLKELAEHYTINDNYHQAVEGGTGANHIMLGSGDAIFFSDDKGNAVAPPENQIENPNPQAGTNNFYTQDGYKGGSYVACADEKAPGVAPVRDFLAALPAKSNPNCEEGHYYLVNNYQPGYLGDGSVNKETFSVPPSKLRTIGDALMEKKISFRYYGEGWNEYAQKKGVEEKDGEEPGYCDICNFLQYTSSIMADTKLRKEHIADLDDFYKAVGSGNLPSVSFVKPSSLNDGHPASSRLDIFEAFAKRLVDAEQAKPDLWKDTAIFIIFDEGGGYWDSGYIQPLDFFGDGPRIPLIVVSPYAQGGHIAHSYSDHVSLLKFIERNWKLAPLTARSRDNLPDPQAAAGNPYVPINSPAIGDLADMFRFKRSENDTENVRTPGK